MHASLPRLLRRSTRAALWAVAGVAACGTPPDPAPGGPGPAGTTADSAPQSVLVERRVGAMGTELAIAIEAPSRAEALAASEAVARAVEAVERRLSTWRTDSELAALNRARAGEPVALSLELAHELRSAAHWARATDGAFDPAVGGLVSAWELRGAGRIPSRAELEAALVPGGIVAGLELDGTRAVRRDARLCLEEGGFGKGAGLDAALAALSGTAVETATLDFGGQVAWYARDGAPERRLDIADPRDRTRLVATLRTARASAATSGNSERARLVEGRPLGHLLDPRSGEFAPDFGSVTVLADRGIDADCLSTGLFVLGPERALEFAEHHEGVDVVVVERLPSGGLSLRVNALIAARVALLDPYVALSSAPEPGRTPAAR